MIKFQKLVTRFMGLGSDMQRYEREARGGGYKVVALHVANDGRGGWRCCKGNVGQNVPPKQNYLPFLSYTFKNCLSNHTA